jgi:hypothetical protein
LAMAKPVVGFWWMANRYCQRGFKSMLQRVALC